jgi:hypothetical protein
VVSYTLITALLGGVFAGLILLTTRVLPVNGPVAVAVATLVIAALFNPLRRRVQRAVDRRFNRARYDAEAIVARSPRDCAGPSIWTRYGAILSASSMRRSSPAAYRCGSPAPGRTPQPQFLPARAPASLTAQCPTGTGPPSRSRPAPDAVGGQAGTRTRSALHVSDWRSPGHGSPARGRPPGRPRSTVRPPPRTRASTPS